MSKNKNQLERKLFVLDIVMVIGLIILLIGFGYFLVTWNYGDKMNPMRYTWGCISIFLHMLPGSAIMLASAAKRSELMNNGETKE